MVKAVSAFFEFLLVDGTILAVLFIAVTWAVSMIQQRFPFLGTQKNLFGSSRWLSSFIASIGGVVTPFCSCSTIPVLSGMLKAGVGFAPSFAFLISSPVINEGVFILLFMTGHPVAGIVFIVAGLIMTTASGVIASQVGLERYVISAPELATSAQYVGNDAILKWPGWRPANHISWMASMQELRSTTPHIVIGLLIGGLIYGTIPSHILVNLISEMPALLLYLICVIIGLPLYVSPIPAIPIGLALIAKGFPIGPLVTFLVAAIGTSPPEIVLLTRLFKIQLVLAHTLTVVLSALILGWLVSSTL